LKESVIEAKYFAKDWINWGAPLPGFGNRNRIVKYSDKPSEHGWEKGTKYFGEWSEIAGQPCGRGFRIDSEGGIYIQYWNGVDFPGSFIDIRSDHAIFVGKCLFNEK